MSNRLLWIDSRLATLNAYMITTSSRKVLHTFHEYPRHPAGLAVFEVTLTQSASLHVDVHLECVYLSVKLYWKLTQISAQTATTTVTSSLYLLNELAHFSAVDLR